MSGDRTAERETVLTPEQKECKKAAEKAMNLLLRQDRTKKELQERLYRAGFSEHASAYAMNYVEGFGYINDLRYAANYISCHKSHRSKKELQYKLMNKGVESDVIAMAMEEYEAADEVGAIAELIRKRTKNMPLFQMSYEEKNKLIAYLARKGYTPAVIKRVIREQEENRAEDSN